MSKWLKGTFLVHAIVALVIGAACLVAPGRVLSWMGFAPLDGFGNFFARLLGASVLALAWTSFRGWLSTEWRQVVLVVEGQVFFDVLGCAGLLRLGLKSGVRWPWLLWATLGLLAAFAAAWIAGYLLARKNRS